MDKESKGTIYVLVSILALFGFAIMEWWLVVILYVIALWLIPAIFEEEKKDTEKKEVKSYNNFKEMELKDNLRPSFTFSISHGPDYSNEKFEWHQKNENVVVKGIEISGGMIYTSPSTSSLPSVISKSLHISKNVAPPYDSLGYWPSYSRITPEQRYTYLKWLADGRKDNIDIGYVFIFFYGLEYRYLVEISNNKKLESEIPDIIKEVERLLSIYQHSNSFNGYAGRFLEFVKMSSKLYKNTKIDYFEAFKNSSYPYTMPFSASVEIGTLIANKQPIPAEMALLWLKYSFMWNSRTAARRCRREFFDMFVKAYNDIYEDGLRVPLKPGKLELSYHPASHDIPYEDRKIVFDNVADLEKHSAILRKIANLANHISNELDLYSRFIGKNENGCKQEANLYLPIGLRNERFSKQIATIKQKHADKNRILFSDLLSELNLKPNVSAKSISFIKDLLQDNGLMIVTSKQKDIKPEDMISVIAVDKGANFECKDLEILDITVQTIGFVYAVSSKDKKSTIDADKFVTTLRTGKSEQNYLKNLMIEATHSDYKLSHIRAMLKNITDGEQFIKNIVHGLGTIIPITPNVIKELEKIGKIVGMEAKEFHSALHQAQNKSTVAKGKKDLDFDKINKLKKESTEISSKLDKEVFSDDKPAKPVKKTSAKKDKTSLGLNAKQEAFFKDIRKKAEWTMKDISAKAKKHDLMLEGALEAINEKVYDLTNNTPIEIDGDLVYIDTEILKDIK